MIGRVAACVGAAVVVMGGLGAVAGAQDSGST